MMNEIWKIRRKRDGKYADGNWPPTFSEVGKDWMSKDDLTWHVASRPNDEVEEAYSGCEFIAYSIVEDHTTTSKSFIVQARNLHKDKLVAALKRKERAWKELVLQCKKREGSGGSVAKKMTNIFREQSKKTKAERLNLVEPG